MSDQTPTSTPAEPPKRSWLPMAAILAAVALVIVVAVGVAFVALQNKPANRGADRRAMAKVALSGIEAMITGNGDALFALSTETMQQDFTPAFVEAMKTSGMKALFEEPAWKGDDFSVVVDTSKGQGVVIGGPVPDGNPVVLYRTMGHLGSTTGGIELTTTPTGWAIVSYVVGPSAPTTSGVSPTGTPAATSTP